jgi:hypothetical protein
MERVSFLKESGAQRPSDILCSNNLDHISQLCKFIYICFDLRSSFAK